MFILQSTDKQKVNFSQAEIASDLKENENNSEVQTSPVNNSKKRKAKVSELKSIPKKLALWVTRTQFEELVNKLLLFYYYYC